MDKNTTLFQFFHWYYSPEGNLWQHACHQAEHLSELGITHVWFPPAYKSAQGLNEAGYAVYDLYDLGEFDQKGTVRTRYGTKDEYLAAVKCMQSKGINVLADIVLNHLTGGNEEDGVVLQKVKDENRNEFDGEVFTGKAYTKFDYPERKGKYSDHVWDSSSFTGVCMNHEIYLLHHEYSNGKWDDVVDRDNGNFDFLLGCDFEFRNPKVREELKKWGVWYAETVGMDGFRLDALKHIATDFFPEWAAHLNQQFKKDFLYIGECWSGDIGILMEYIDKTEGKIRLFDSPLHFRFYEASMSGGSFDMRTIFDNTLVQLRPELAITFVDNHDTQPLQSLESLVEYWFLPHAYTLILLREQGMPCIFYPHLYEAKYIEKGRDGSDVYVEMNKVVGMEQILIARKEFAYGNQNDYFDHPNTVGWTREGVPELESSGCAVIMSNSEEGYKDMYMGAAWANATMIDLLGNRQDTVEISNEGWGRFPVNGGSVSIWIKSKN